jgi:hypothetical protein
LQNAANELRNQQAAAEQEARIAAIEDAHNSGRMKDEDYYKAIDAAKMGEKLYEIAYGKPAGGTFDAKTAMDLRKEFQAKNKDYYTVGDAYGKIIKVSEKPSAAGDLSLIFNYMKMLDPGSTVRESEFANAENARAWFDQNNTPTYVRLAYEKARTGKMLLPEQRADFLNQAQNIYSSQLDRFNNESQFYTNIANQSGINPEYVVYNPYDFGASKQEQYPEGTVIENEKGVRMVLRGGQWQQM